MRKYALLIGILSLLLCFQCPNRQESSPTSTAEAGKTIITGAMRLDTLLPMLSGKRVALVVNHTSMIGETHLADTLKALGVDLKKVMAPEHGFRGNADAGEYLKDGIDKKLGLPVVSLYGQHRKASPEQLADIDIAVFDIQDVGVRFYTYISTLHNLMEACAENNKKVIVLDRPNPNGSYIDGPVLQPEFKSFVGMHPIPIVHGMTVGEFARMINGEKWLKDGVTCDLTIIPLKNWTHDEPYSLPVKPSPNLPTDQSIKLYPSVCLFEGTVISVGRGTYTPFEVFGNPLLKDMPYQFTPVSIEGMSKKPPFENEVCYGLDLRTVPVAPKVTLKYLIDLYNAYPEKDKFFNNYFDKLAGNSTLKEQIKKGMTEEAIRESWKMELEKYAVVRKKYLLYQ